MHSVSGDVDLAPPVSDEELTRLALAADPDAPLAPDAVPFEAGGDSYPELLPSWYMPVPRSFRRTRGRRVVVGLLVSSFLVVNALGLCVTSGHLTIAW